jgi:hypothetical protein
LSSPPASAVTGSKWDYANGVYTVKDGQAVTISGTTTTNRLVINGTATVTLDEVSITDVVNPLSLGSGADMTLRLTGINALSGGRGSSGGIDVGSGTLTIVSATGGAEGTLNVSHGLPIGLRASIPLMGFSASWAARYMLTAPTGLRA